MGVAWYVALEEEIDGVDPVSVDGKALARLHPELDRVAAELGHRPLSGFLSVGASDLGDLIEDVEAPPESWFAAEDGLTVVRAVLSRTRADAQLASAVADLEGVERLLQGAAKAGVRFRLSVDF